MIKIYFTEPFAGYRRHPILYKTNGIDIDQLGVEIKAEQFSYDYEAATDPSACDIIFVPHLFSALTPSLRALLEERYESVKKYNKPFVVMFFGDKSDESHLPFGYILKTSAYRRTLKQNEYVMPAYSEDWSDSEGFKTLPKEEKPAISFCGMAGFTSKSRYLKYLAKVSLSLLDRAKAPGLYFRRRLLSVFGKSPLFTKNFIVRTSFSSSRSTLKGGTYAEVRKDFYDSITSSHFVIAPKGDGNYSNRFFEALSLGRIPVCPDTDMILPLDDTLDYSAYSVIEPIGMIHKMPETVRKFYDTIPDIEEHQRKTQKFYKENLRFDVCFMRTLHAIHDRHRTH